MSNDKLKRVKKKMKNFKKISALVASAVMLVSAVGCSTNDTVSQIISKTSELGSYSGTVDLEAEVNTQEKSMKYGMVSDISAQTDPFFAEVNIITKSDDANVGGEYSSKIYLTTDNGVNTAYAGYNDEWYKQIIPSENFKYAVSQYNPADNAVLFMQSATSLTNVGTEEFHGYTTDKYTGTIAKGLVPDLMETTGAISLVGQNIDASYYENAEDLSVTFWVNAVDGIIVGYSLDLTDTVNHLFDKLQESSTTDDSQKLSAVSYTCDAVITDYNNEINTTLPDAALNATLIANDSANSGTDSGADSGEGSAS